MKQIPSVWRLEDAKAQFSAVVDRALLGVPQFVTRRGKDAVVVLSSEDYSALQSRPESAQSADRNVNFVEHLLAMPKIEDWSVEDAMPGDTDLRPRELGC